MLVSLVNIAADCALDVKKEDDDNDVPANDRTQLDPFYPLFFFFSNQTNPPNLNQNCTIRILKTSIETTRLSLKKKRKIPSPKFNTLSFKNRQR